MKRKLVVVAALLMAMAVYGVATAAISGSAHDLTVAYPGTGETCVYCHAPHNPTPGNQPLWNHTLSDTAGYTMYGTTIAGTTPDAVPNTPSLMCLGCHDGVTNVDAYGGATGTAVMTGTDVVGKDLSNDHPVSITPSTEVTVPSDWLRAGKVECESCHEPHTTGTVPVDFLRLSNTNSDLCTSCHTTK